MLTLHFKVSQQRLQWLNPCRSPIEGTAGNVQAQFEVDDEWAGLTIMAVFEHDALVEQPEPVLWTGEPITVPAAALAAEGRLRVGLVGLAEDGQRRLTTRRMPQGIPVQPSAGTGGTAVDPDPALWEQTLAIIGNMDDLETPVKSTLVGAINEAARSGSGGGADIDRSEVVTVVDELPDPSGEEQVVYLIDDPTDTSVAWEPLLITILSNAVYSVDQSANIAALAALLGVDTGDEPEDSGITQVESTLIITSGVTVSQSGTTLTLS